MHVVQKDVESLERQANGMHYALFGIPEVPGSGLVTKVDQVSQQLEALRRGILALAATGMVGLGIQLVIHYA